MGNAAIRKSCQGKNAVHSGSAITKEGGNTSSTTAGNKTEEPEKLTEEEKALISVCWVEVEKHAANIGVVSFMRLFEMHPEMKDEFIPFKSIDVQDERFNQILRNHGLKVLTTVGKMVHRLDNEEKMMAVVKGIGTRHVNYSADSALIEVRCASGVIKLAPPGWEATPDTTVWDLNFHNIHAGLYWYFPGLITVPLPLFSAMRGKRSDMPTFYYVNRGDIWGQMDPRH